VSSAFAIRSSVRENLIFAVDALKHFPVRVQASEVGWSLHPDLILELLKKESTFLPSDMEMIII
jgi:hypothetical protein